MTSLILGLAILGIAALCVLQFVDVEIIRGRKNDRIKAWLMEGNYREGK